MTESVDSSIETQLETSVQLNQLVAIVSRLSHQVSQVSQQISQVAAQITETNDRIEHLAKAGQSNPTLTLPEPTPSSQALHQPFANPADLLARLTSLESQVRQLTNRVQSLERNSPRLDPIALGQSESQIDDEEIEDEPDEILWDFMEPGLDGESKPH